MSLHYVARSAQKVATFLLLLLAFTTPSDRVPLMAELTTAAVVPDVTNKVIHPPPQRSTLKVLASCAGFAVFAAVVAVAVTFGAGWRGHMGHGVPSYLEADGADVMRQRVFGTCVAHVQARARATRRAILAQSIGAQFFGNLL